MFGITPVPVNGNGFGGSPPARGQAPAFCVEVDMTPPTVQLSNINPEGGAVTVSWQAQDQNFGSGPVALYYRTGPDGPWKMMASNLGAQGSHRWQCPRDQGASFYVRVSATDRAGNNAHTETSSPLTLDLTEPELVILGAAAAERQPRPLPVEASPPPAPPLPQTQGFMQVLDNVGPPPPLVPHQPNQP